MHTVQRNTDQLNGFSVPASAAGKGILFGSYSSGEVRVPSTSALVGPLTWYSGDALYGPWYPCQDGAGNAVTSTIAAGNACLIPVNCFGCKYILPVAATAGLINIDLKA